MLTVAIPSKGRLQEQVQAFLADAGLHLTQSRGARDYAASFKGLHDVAVTLLSAAEIADELQAGRVHLGISGEDLLREHGSAQDRVHVVEKLGFGRANVVVAVPRAWIDVATMADLDDVASAFHLAHHRRLRIATKYVNLTRAFFAGHGVSGYRIVESLGATEGAPAAGTAEAIVDITTTGATLAQNELKVLDDGLILESQAVLAASLRAQWSDAVRVATRTILDRIAARAAAKSAAIIRVRMDLGVEAALPTLERNHGAKILSRPPSGGEASILIPEANLTAAIAHLRATGAQGTISTQKTDYVFTPENPLFAKLQAKLAGA
jgi:ATP phosphoribosyltransferase